MQEHRNIYQSHARFQEEFSCIEHKALNKTAGQGNDMLVPDAATQKDTAGAEEGNSHWKENRCTR